MPEISKSSVLKRVNRPIESNGATRSVKADPNAEAKKTVLRWIETYVAGAALLGLGIGLYLFVPPTVLLYGAGTVAVAAAGARALSQQ